MKTLELARRAARLLGEPDVVLGPDRDLVRHAAAVAVGEVEFGELAAGGHTADAEVLG